MQSLRPLFFDRRGPLENLDEAGDLRVSLNAGQRQISPAGRIILPLLLDLKSHGSAGAHDFGELRLGSRAQAGILKKSGRFQTDFGLQNEPSLGVAHPDCARFAAQADHRAFQQLGQKHVLGQRGGLGQFGNFGQQARVFERRVVTGRRRRFRGNIGRTLGVHRITVGN